MSQRTALYRLFSAEDELLYIGISWRPLSARMSGHAGVKPWWEEVHHATAIWYGSPEDADWAETEAIRTEHPKYNIAKTGMRPPRRRQPPDDSDVFVRHDGDGTWIRIPPEVVSVSFTYPSTPERRRQGGGSGGACFGDLTIGVWSRPRATQALPA